MFQLHKRTHTHTIIMFSPQSVRTVSRNSFSLTGGARTARTHGTYSHPFVRCKCMCVCVLCMAERVAPHCTNGSKSKLEQLKYLHFELYVNFARHTHTPTLTHFAYALQNFGSFGFKEKQACMCAHTVSISNVPSIVSTRCLCVVFACIQMAKRKFKIAFGM